MFGSAFRSVKVRALGVGPLTSAALVGGPDVPATVAA